MNLHIFASKTSRKIVEHQIICLYLWIIGSTGAQFVLLKYLILRTTCSTLPWTKFKIYKDLMITAIHLPLQVLKSNTLKDMDIKFF